MDIRGICEVMNGHALGEWSSMSKSVRFLRVARIKCIYERQHVLDETKLEHVPIEKTIWVF